MTNYKPLKLQISVGWFSTTLVGSLQPCKLAFLPSNSVVKELICKYTYHWLNASIGLAKACTCNKARLDARVGAEWDSLESRCISEYGGVLPYSLYGGLLIREGTCML